MMSTEMQDSSTLVGHEKIDSLNRTAWEIRFSDPHRSLVLSREAVSLAEALHYHKGRAYGLRTLGFCHVRLSLNTEAYQFLQDARLIFDEIGDHYGGSQVRGFLGMVYRNLGNYTASLESLFESLQIYDQHDDLAGRSLAYHNLGCTYKYLGDYKNALDYLLQGLSITRALPERLSESYLVESYQLNMIGMIYFETGNYSEALVHFQQSLALRRELGDKWGEAGCLDNIGNTYFKLGDYEQAREFCLGSLHLAEGIADRKGQGNALFNLSNIYLYSGDRLTALRFATESLRIRESLGDKKGQAEVLLFLGELYAGTDAADRNLDRALECLHRSLQLGEEVAAKDILFKIHLGLSKALKQRGNYQQALVHFEKFSMIEKEVYNESVSQHITNLQISHQVEQTQKEAESYRLHNIELARLVEELNRQKEETEKQKAALQEALDHLEKTQEQLIHREKMASLGALAAGIAHEIRNPLNFINNFALLSLDLATEFDHNLKSYPQAHSDMEDLVSDLKVNMQKISTHGKRADGIVRSMLEHSRDTHGRRQPAEVNEVLEEYVNLAYHSARAQHPDFEVVIERDYDPSVGKIEIVPKEIGQVFLNLLTNAFYAVSEKRSRREASYRPVVSVTTKRRDGAIEIRVKDNGPGIPESIRTKIFEPFFTTKPPGEGTGLGLSLSYDIVTRGHGGSMIVESKDGEGATFLVVLPDRQSLASPVF